MGWTLLLTRLNGVSRNEFAMSLESLMVTTPKLRSTRITREAEEKSNTWLRTGKGTKYASIIFQQMSADNSTLFLA